MRTQRLKEKIRINSARIELTSEYKQSADKIIEQKVLELLPEDGIVLCYASTAREPSTELLLKVLISQNRLALPRCDVIGEISPVVISDMNMMVPGRYGIPAPDNSLPAIMNSELSAIVFPCVSCDISGYRLGRGGGYYDHLLSSTNCLTICLCYDKLLVQKIPYEPHDMKPDCIVTENEVLWETNTVN